MGAIINNTLLCVKWILLLKVSLNFFLERQTRKRTQESNVILIDWTSDDDGCDVDDLNPVFKRKAIRNSGFGDDGFSVEITRIPKNAAAKSESKLKVQRPSVLQLALIF